MILGAVLAGGRASRFGSDKALAHLGGERLIDRAVSTLTRWTDAVVVVGGPDRGYPVVRDRPRPGLGPLGGIAGALEAASARACTSVLTLACDTPIVPDPLLEALLRRFPSFCSETPVMGHWPAELHRDILAYLESEATDLSVASWARAIGALPISSGQAIPNVNTPADLDSLSPQPATP